eukprot:953467-Prymnesium_polylepis.1
MTRYLHPGCGQASARRHRSTRLRPHALHRSVQRWRHVRRVAGAALWRRRRGRALRRRARRSRARRA